jgi:hypothetical protein
MTATDSTDHVTVEAGHPSQAEQDAKAQRGFSRSIMVSAVRCLLTYIALPFLTPLLNLAPGVGPLIGLPLGAVAVAANVLSIRRFWAANHRWKVQVTVLHAAVLVLLAVLIVQDLQELLS